MTVADFAAQPTASPPTRRPPLAGPLGRLASRVYARVIARRNRAWDRGEGVITFDRPVISVGNLSVGGTGKTPAVLRLIRALLDDQRRPCVAMRGYASPTGRGEDSDEARLYAAAFPGVPIVAQPNRVEGLLDLFAAERGRAVDCVLLDDGFQHRRVARQCDIVLIDATRSPFDDALLPAGWLREPVASLARAHAVLLTHADRAGRERVAALARRVREVLPPRAVVAACAHAWGGFTRHDPGTDDRNAAGAPVAAPVGALRGRRVFAACAIGNPDPFLDAARGACAGPLAGALILRDHDPYAPPTLARLVEALQRTRAEALLVTPKDWTKLDAVHPARWPCPVYVPTLDLRFESGEHELLGLVREAAGLDLSEPRAHDEEGSGGESDRDVEPDAPTRPTAG
ncbi:MAG: tetraacyldisaccharide 4'-kinase [Planctomycetota bacterium]|nr:tetraacyldisaccharide 4'-kinase [Planctomycetota bacterium]